MIIDNNFILNDENLSYLELLGSLDINSLKKFKDIYNLDNLTISEISKIFKRKTFLFLNNKHEFANLFSLLLDKIDGNTIEIQNNKIIKKNHILFIYHNDLLIKETNDKDFVFKEYLYNDKNLLISTSDHTGTNTKFEYNDKNLLIKEEQINIYVEDHEKETIYEYNSHNEVILNIFLTRNPLPSGNG